MLIKTISNRSVFGDKEKTLETVMSDKTREHFMYRVYGEIDGYSTRLSKFKRVNTETKVAEDVNSTRFSGDFEAVNVDGEVFEASTAYLPDYVSGSFITALDNDHSSTLQFAFDIFVVYSKSAATSYEYIAKPVRPKDEIPKLETLKAQMPPLPGQGPKALEHKARKA